MSRTQQFKVPELAKLIDYAKKKGFGVSKDYKGDELIVTFYTAKHKQAGVYVNGIFSVDVQEWEKQDPYWSFKPFIEEYSMSRADRILNEAKEPISVDMFADRKPSTEELDFIKKLKKITPAGLIPDYHNNAFTVMPVAQTRYSKPMLALRSGFTATRREQEKINPLLKKFEKDLDALVKKFSGWEKRSLGWGNGYARRGDGKYQAYDILIYPPEAKDTTPAPVASMQYSSPMPTDADKTAQQKYKKKLQAILKDAEKVESAGLFAGAAYLRQIINSIQ